MPTQARCHTANLCSPKPSLWRKRLSPAMLLAATCGVSACSMFVSNDEFGLLWSGQSVDQLKTARGQPSGEEKHTDGSTEIRYDMADIRCTYWFTVDKTGKLVAYRYAVGEWGSCKPT